VSPAPRLVLASASPRRHALLAALGLPHDVVVPRFDEATLRHLAPRAQALAAARAKAAEVAARRSGAWVVGADTVVELEGRALGKPADRAEAGRMLGALSGRDHEVISAVAVVNPGGDEATGWALSMVRFRRLEPAEIDDYIAGGEPMDKAGAYAIQGGAAAFAGVMRGRVDTVVGLPGHVVARLLGRLGHPDAARVARASRDGGSANLHRR
jgi:septum formation protein